MNPLVSVCIPVFNSENFIRETLKSIESQTYSNIEVIISDNKSTDNSVNIIKEFTSKNNWLLLEAEETVSPAENFDKLIDTAVGEYIAIYHSDDVYHPEIIEKSINCFKKTNVNLVSTMGNLIDSYGVVTGEFVPSSRIDITSKLDLEEVMLGVSDRGNNKLMLLTPSVMVKRSLYIGKKFKYFEHIYKSACDYAMWFELIGKGHMFLIKDKLINYRIHASQGSETQLRTNLNIPDIILVIDDYLKRISNLSSIGQINLDSFRLVLITAFKQNERGFFLESLKSLESISNGYLLIKTILVFFNKIKFKLPYSKIIKAIKKYA